MVKAVVRQGEIRPLEPLPADWREGQTLRVEKADDIRITGRAFEFETQQIRIDFIAFADIGTGMVWKRERLTTFYGVWEPHADLGTIPWKI